ncbi:hypothetical protein ACFX2C_007701 [Malus domestica]
MNQNLTRRREVHGEDGVQVSMNDIPRWDSSVGRRKISSDQVEEKVESCLEVEDKSASLISTRRPSSAVWSETNEATSSSCSQSEEDTADTDYACNCERLNAFCESPFRFVLKPTPSPSGSRPKVNDRSSSMSVQMAWLMKLLKSNLEAKSKIYRDSALCYVFMMNNGRYIVQKAKDSELGLLLDDDWIQKHTAKVRQYHAQYIEKH